jgi:transposase InsO family protein
VTARYQGATALRRSSPSSMRMRTRTTGTTSASDLEFTASDFAAAGDRLGVSYSAGRVGSCFDNAVVESWHSTLEFELLDRQRFATKAEARPAVARFIDT